MEIIRQIITDPCEMQQVEHLQRLVWPGNETEIMPVHLMIAVVRNGGILIGAYLKNQEVLEDREGIVKLPESGLPLIGFVFGFPGFYQTPDGPRLMHISHNLGVHPQYRNFGLGFMLKRAQWQMVRQQGIDRITWTYDPLLSRNAHLNISKLGAVCNTYIDNYYGDLRDELNLGLPTDRFQVDWWVNTERVYRRLSQKTRKPLGINNYVQSGARVVNRTSIDEQGILSPEDDKDWESASSIIEHDLNVVKVDQVSFLLVEIPVDFDAIKKKNIQAALKWRLHLRKIFKKLINLGYLVTDFLYDKETSRSYYVLTHGESML